MDIGDPNDPNLDGDFLAIIERRQKKNTPDSDADAIFEEINRDVASRKNRVERQSCQARPNSGGNSGAAATVSEEIVKIRDALFFAIDKKDAAAFKGQTKTLSTMNLTLTSEMLRLAEDRSTVLNYAIRKECWPIVDYVLDSTTNDRIVCEDYTVTVRKVVSHKSNMHLLAELGNVLYAKKIIDKIDKPDSMLQYLNRFVLVEPEGQRPRPLNCLHIASLYGRTQLVDLFCQYGVDVNATNNKNDTPVLWAARGNHIETVRRLINLGANLQLENDKGSTPLYWAIRYGLTDLSEILIREGKANVHQRRKLGLVSPIILASALGYADIVQILLDNGADPNETFNHGQTSLHVASAEGNDDVIEVLLRSSKVKVNQTDSNGNTALLFAAKSGYARTIKLLVRSGADFDARNKQDVTIWDHIFKKEDVRLLKAICDLYKVYKISETESSNNNNGSGDRDEDVMRFPVGATPLHVAAANGDLEKLKFLLENGAEPASRDLNGNTYFHVAARENHANILTEFLNAMNLEDANSSGDTAMHVACKSGNHDACQVLLQKSKLDARNKMSRIPFHEAVESSACKPETVRLIIGHTIKANNWSLVDAKDKSGNTALHIAAQRGRIDVLNELKNLNPNITNNDGDTPFHVACKSPVENTLETLISIFNRNDNGVNLDQTNSAGECCLHICARRGDAANISLLIACGADLSLKDRLGNSVIHVLVEESMIEPHKLDALIETYKTIVKNSTKWWCMLYNLSFPAEESELHLNITRRAMIYLLSHNYNDDQLNVIEFAISLTAIDFLEEIINTPNVYRFKEEREYLYDVTNILPDNQIARKKKKRASVAAINNNPENSKLLNFETRGNRAVDLIINLEDDIVASKILDITPIKQIMRNYWKKYEWIYIILMLLHISYMVLLMIFTNPISASIVERFNASTTSISCSDNPFDNKYALFIIWPALIVLCESIFLVAGIFNFVKDLFVLKRITKPKECKFNVFGALSNLLNLLISNIAHICSVIFLVTVILTFLQYRCPTSLNSFLTYMSLAFIFGWCYTMTFTKAFANLHGFTIMLKYIVLRDITRFLAIYVIILLACGMAFYVLFQISPTIADMYGPSLSATIFGTFNMMLGLGSLLDQDFDKAYVNAGGNPGFIKVVFTLYVIISSVILLSLLVAMMTDTYTSIQAREGTTWKIGSLRLAIKLERAVPFLKSIGDHCCSRNEAQYDAAKGRWFLNVSYREVSVNRLANIDNDEIYKTIQRVENKLDHVQIAYANLESKFNGFILRHALNESKNAFLGLKEKRLK